MFVSTTKSGLNNLFQPSNIWENMSFFVAGVKMEQFLTRRKKFMSWLYVTVNDALKRGNFSPGGTAWLEFKPTLQELATKVSTNQLKTQKHIL